MLFAIHDQFIYPFIVYHVFIFVVIRRRLIILAV